MTRPRTIAIDGPAGSGKSTISEQLARRYGYTFLDTGVFYRAITYLSLQAQIAPDDDLALEPLLLSLKLSILADPQRGDRIIANGEDVTDQLRTSAVEAGVSAIAQNPLVRESILPLQRQIAEQGNIILAGRDIGTVVLPDADLKLYIDASLEERARRRHAQNIEAGKTSTQETVTTDLARRDRVDSERATAPLSKADDAIYILTDGKTIEQVVDEISPLIEN